MQSNYFLLLLLTMLGFGATAQTLSITVTDEGQPMAYHDITVSHGDYVIGTGRTNSRGFVSIYAPKLRGKSVDVAGKYQNGGTKKEWSIKGKLKLDNSNSLRIQLEKIGEDIEKSRAEMKQRQKAMSDRMKNRMSNRKSIFDEEDDKKIKKTTPKNNSTNKLPNTNNSTTGFEAGLTKLKNTMSSFDKEDIALELVKSNSLNTNQIKQIMEELTSDFTKKDVAIAAYTNCTDKQNYETVINTMSSSFTKRDVKKATIDK